MKRRCIQCGNEFNARGKRGLVAKFCSHKCKGKFQEGKPNTSTTKFKKGHSTWNKGTRGIITAWNKGKAHSEITRKKISSHLKSLWRNSEYRKMMSRKHTGKTGRSASNWQGGVTPENTKIRNSIEFALWRKSVFARDLFICQCCSQSGGYLHAHHINNFADFPELRLDIKNGITLCKKCHRKFHKKYMRKNNTKEQLVEFFDGTNGVLTLA